jgi:hypothetical protein
MSQDPYNPESFQNMGTDFFEQHPTIPVPQRQTIVPSWYQRHQDPQNTVVKQNGEPVPPGFKVAQVAPELRWAIGEDGELMPQLEFERSHEQWYNEQYRFVGQPVDDPNLRSIPLVERFVARTVDPYDDTRLQPIQAEKVEKAPPVQPVYNANGELVEEAGEVEKPAGASVKPAANPVPPPEPVETAPPEPEPKGFVTPCGRPLSAERYMQQHMKSNCGNEECEALAQSLKKE